MLSLFFLSKLGPVVVHGLLESPGCTHRRIVTAVDRANSEVYFVGDPGDQIANRRHPFSLNQTGLGTARLIRTDQDT